MALKAPFISEDILKQGFASAARFPIGTVVGAHNGFYLCFLDAGLKCRKIGFIHILQGSFCIKLMTHRFRSAMYCKVLGTCCYLHVVFIMSLKAFNISHTQSGGQIRVFSEGLMTSSPSGVSKNIYIGRPEGQSLVNIGIIKFLLHIKFRTRFCRNCFSQFLKQILIKACSKSHCLREYGSDTRSCHAVKSFIPPVVRLNAKTFIGCRTV